MKRIMSVALVLLFVVSTLIIPVRASAATAPNFTPSPQTDYAKDFIAKCDGQQWFINEVERILNENQKTLDLITSSSDLDIIKSLGLKDQDITGQIPRAIGELKELRTLFLSGNNLSEDVPTELFTLPKLYNIDLSDNDYTGPIPSGFGTMASIQILMLRGNAWTGTIPASILSNTSIQTLDVSSNKLSGPVPPELNNMTGLQYLAISDNSWDAGAIPDFSALTKLMTLSAWNCSFTGEIPDYLYNMTPLQILDLAVNNFTGEISPNIANLVNLQLLALGSNQLSGTVPDAFGPLTNLRTIDISDNKLRGTLPTSLANPGLLVYAQDNYMTGDVLKGLANNQNNFCDGATTPQYQLTASSPVTISKTATTNIYLKLQNKPLAAGMPSKSLLPPDCYMVVTVLNDPEGKITVTWDANGIYVQANDDVPLSDGIKITITIKDNTGSDYSTVDVAVTTDVAPSGGGGGGGTMPTTQDTVTHNPYITGYPDGTFGPERTITREEVATMLIRALEIQTDTITTAPFSDVAPDRWSAPYIAKAQDEGFVTGYPDGTFAPGQPMTRAELATCLVRIMEANSAASSGTNITFSDVPAGQWYSDYVTKAAAMGLVTGYPDGTFKPNQTVTRAEAVTMINRMLGRDPNTAPVLATMECPFSDITTAHWAYLQVMEASVLHEHPVG